ncbi:MAG: hypothetical protein K9K66_06855 [Desulfarculaceae bacterium]|nr:hypothetical protein [Desulfarculaceae bacterium]MCF8071809.1 hypothetical protein [Desulfarculaceae bacterium]MCF8101359.1 hypothetical protein [Desulfarculaceae bacterium]
MLLAGLLLLGVSPALAGGCFPDVYYQMMFKPVSLEALPGGDTRLGAFSDFLAAKGEDPHSDQGSGCMCGVNNGRWDQGLVNASPADPLRAPVALRIDKLHLDLFTRKGKPQGQSFGISGSRLAACLNSGLKKGDWRRFDAPGGAWKAPGTLEPGENLIGCVCLKPEDRRKSGYVKLKVSYTPLIAATSLPGPGAAQKHKGGKTALEQTVKIGPLPNGGARYYLFSVPAGAADASLRLTLAPGAGLKLYTSQAWQPKQSAWQSGDHARTIAAGKTLLVMVRATKAKAGGELKLSMAWAGPKAKLPASASKALPAGAPGARVFKVYVLGMGTSSKASSSFDSAPAQPCCDGN